VFGDSAYRDALAAAQQAWRTPQQLPSARVLDTMRQGEDCGFTAFVHERALRSQQEILALPWTQEQQARFEREAQQSLAEQAAIEAADTMPFEAFRQDYVSADRLMPALATAA
jgi:glutamate--cysteine ligase